MGKCNLLVDFRATKHVITDKSKFINSDQNLEPGNHFVELVDGSRENNRGNTCIYLCNSKGHMCRYILRNALYIPTFKQNIFSVEGATKNGTYISFECKDCQLIYSNGPVFDITRKERLYYLKKLFLPEIPLTTYIIGIKS